MNEVDRENSVGDGQGGPVHPVAQALRSTFRADNHDTLGSELTGLMIDLSRVPFDAADHLGPPVVLPAQSRPLETPPTVGAGRLSRLFNMLRGR